MRFPSSLKKDGLFPVEIKEQGVLNKDIDFSIGKKVKPRDLKCVLPAVRQHHAGRRAHEGSTADDDRADREQMAQKGDLPMCWSTWKRVIHWRIPWQHIPDIFPPMLVNMVRAGESSGSLEMSFNRMATHFEKEAKLKATIRKATIYPIILICAVIGVIAVMLLVCYPDLH